MGLTPDDLRELLAAFEDSTWQEMSVSVEGDTLHVSRRDSAPDSGPGLEGTVARGTDASVPPPAPSAVAPAHSAAPPATAPQAGPTRTAPADADGGPPRPEATGTPVPAPSVGLFWRAPSPGADPFVEVGTRVGPDDTIGIVEVMKLMNRVPAGVAGVVTAVLVGNGGMVEHGQPLVLIDPSA